MSEHAAPQAQRNKSAAMVNTNVYGGAASKHVLCLVVALCERGAMLLI
jgi:hypothetical protein